MHAVLLDDLGVDPELGCVRPQITARRLGRLFHNVAKLAGQRESAAAGQERRLDEQHLAAHLGPGHSGRNSGRKLLSRFFRINARRAKVPFDLLGGDRDLFGQALGDLQSDLSGKIADGAFELADARLACVA